MSRDGSLKGLQERPFPTVPIAVRIVFLLAFFLQLLWEVSQPDRPVQAKDMLHPPASILVRLLSLDEGITASKLLMLCLQTFDNQPGISIPLKDLPYNKIEAWLALLLSLDPLAQYPLLAASRIYTYVPDIGKKRQMIEFVRNRFIEWPEGRWSWMAHGVLLAKHQLKDLQYAQMLAKSLREQTAHIAVPDWIRYMEVFILEDMGEYEAARILIGGLLAYGMINDVQELRYLERRMLDKQSD